MWRSGLVALLLVTACHGRSSTVADAVSRDSPRVSPDASYPDAPPPPPPSVDAAPPPMPACGDAGVCALPPSTCLDSNYLVYYTGGACDAGTCQFTSNLMYCYGGCVNGGCLGGFT